MIPNRLKSLLFGPVATLLTVFLFAGGAAAETFKVGVVPQFEARKLARIWKPILEEISNRTGYSFEMVGAPRIPDFEKSFMAGEYDFAYMNPLHAVLAHEAQGYVPLVRDGARQLYGILVVREDSPYQGVTSLEGETIAFPAPNSLGASLLIRADLTKTHGVNFEPNYVATHGSAYLNVVIGQTAAAGGVMGTYRSQPLDISEQLRVLYETDRVPPHPFTAHPRVPKQVQQDVQSAMLELWKTGYGREMLEQVPIQEVSVTTIDEYQSLNDMELDAFIVR